MQAAGNAPKNLRHLRLQHTKCYRILPFVESSSAHLILTQAWITAMESFNRFEATKIQMLLNTHRDYVSEEYMLFGNKRN